MALGKQGFDGVFYCVKLMFYHLKSRCCTSSSTAIVKNIQLHYEEHMNKDSSLRNT